MLGRMWDFYSDVWYSPEETTQLRGECLKVQASTSNPLALDGLAVLIQACHEASAVAVGLFLAAD
jgi:hypothetical protein